MPYTPSVNSTITLNTTSVDGPTFNHTIFCAKHIYFPDTERVRSYGSWDDIKADTDIPAASVAYNTARLAFSQGALNRFYIGRRAVDEITLTPSVIVNTASYGFTVVVTETANSIAVTSVPSIVSDASATADEIATALFTDADTGPNVIANVTVTDETGSIKLIPDAGFTIQLTAMVKLADTYVSTETASELLTEIQEENNDWYFMSADDHSETFVLSMAQNIEATGSSDYPKMYTVATEDANSIVALPEPVIDLGGKLQELNYLRTMIEWNHAADTTYNEVSSTAYNGPYQAGGTTWKFMQLVGVEVVKNPTTLKTLSTNKQGFLEDRNMNWFGSERGVDFYREGKTSSGEWIDVVRGSDWINNEIEVVLLNLLLNQRGGKIAFTAAGIAQVTNTVDTVLKRAVDLGILEGYVPCKAPTAANVPFADKVDRILDLIDWTGYLAGAIHTIFVNGNLTYSQGELV